MIIRESFANKTNLITGGAGFIRTLSGLSEDSRSGNPYIVRSKTRIGRGTFIGGPSVVYPGVPVGDRCIMMPMSLLTSDVRDNTMVGGSPARVIKQVDDAYIDRFKATLAPQSDRQGQP